MTTKPITDKTDAPSILFNALQNSFPETILKITAIVLAILAGAAFIITLSIGSPIIIPICIALVTIALEILFLGLYKCILKKIFVKDLFPPQKPHRCSPDIANIKSIASSKALLEILTAHPRLTHQDIGYLRNIFLESQWQLISNIKQYLENQELQLKGKEPLEQSLILKSLKYPTTLLLSNAVDINNFPHILPQEQCTDFHFAHLENIDITTIQEILNQEPVDLGNIVSALSQVYYQQIYETLKNWVQAPQAIYCKAINMSAIFPEASKNKVSLMYELSILGFIVSLDHLLSNSPITQKCSSIVLYDIHSKLKF